VLKDFTVPAVQDSYPEEANKTRLASLLYACPNSGMSPFHAMHNELSLPSVLTLPNWKRNNQNKARSKYPPALISAP